MFHVFTQSNCCLGIEDGELHQWVHLMLCNLPAIQAHHFSRGNLSTEYELYRVVTKKAWVGSGLPSWYFENYIVTKIVCTATVFHVLIAIHQCPNIIKMRGVKSSSFKHRIRPVVRYKRNTPSIINHEHLQFVPFVVLTPYHNFVLFNMITSLGVCFTCGQNCTYVVVQCMFILVLIVKDF